MSSFSINKINGIVKEVMEITGNVNHQVLSLHVQMRIGHQLQSGYCYLFLLLCTLDMISLIAGKIWQPR